MGRALLFCALWLAAGCSEGDPLERVRALQDDGHFEKSLEPLRELLAERPDDAEVHFRYGHALSITGYYGHAAWSLSKAMEDPEWTERAARQLGLGALRSGDFDAAIAAANRLLELDEESLPGLLIRSEAYTYSKQDPEAGLADAERALELHPDKPDGLKPKIIALIELERIDEAEEAIAAFGEWIDRDQSAAKPALKGWHCATEAIFTEESGEIEQAGEMWEDCLERFPTHSNVMSNAVAYFDTRRDFTRSIEILRTALEKLPAAFTIRTALSERLRAVGQHEEAARLLEEATESASPELQLLAWLTLAEHHQALGDFAAGAEAADRAAEVAESAELDHPHIPFEHAEALLLAGRLDEALAVAEDMEIGAYQALIRARVAQERGEYAQALEHFDDGFRLWPDNANARYMAALAAESAGDFARAIEEYRYSIRIAPGETDARLRLARLHTAERQPMLAIQVLRVRVGQAALEIEGELLSMRLWAWLSQDGLLTRNLKRLENANSPFLAAAYASAAEGHRDRAGPDAAVSWLREAEAIDLRAPRDAAALRALLRFSHEAGELEKAEATLREALAAHPDAAVFHAVRGFASEVRGLPDEAGAAYGRALELDAEQPEALAGLAGLVLDDDPERARELFARARVADPGSIDARIGEARALLLEGRGPDAERHLEALLRERPDSGEAATQLAELRLSRGAPLPGVLRWSQQGARFGGGAPAFDLLSRVYEELGDAEKATAAAARAQALREVSPEGPVS